MHEVVALAYMLSGPWYHDQLGKMFPQETFFDQLDSEGFTWRNYFNDTPWELFIESVAHNPENLVSMEQVNWFTLCC